MDTYQLYPEVVFQQCDLCVLMIVRNAVQHAKALNLKTTVGVLDFWAFSIYLEAVAILPQLVLLQRSGNVDNLTGQYVLFLGAYRGLYIVNWIYRYFTEDHFTTWIGSHSYNKEAPNYI
ncbi:ER lumen protein retaining receptor protein [Raphanus sativus]|nr:ER lumen protein retaining receptor protein [Raphanus sativus]